MFTCPSCDRRLRRTKNTYGLYWYCTECKGRAVTVPSLRRAVARQYVDQLWVQAWQKKGIFGRSCPACRDLMIETAVQANPSEAHLDVCRRCQFVWFDHPEFEEALEIPPRPSARLAREAHRADVQHKTERMVERARDADTPDEWWKYIPGMFGLPVEHTAPGLRSHPWLTWSLAVFIATLSILAFTYATWFIDRFGLVPVQAWRNWGTTLITSFFIHAGWVHLAGNVYFLMVFGDNVEDFLGRWRYVLLILLSILVGDLLHIAGDPDSPSVCLGASGGISGIITFYALRFPRAQLSFLWGRFLRWVRIPAYIALLLWILFQAIGAWLQIKGLSNVSALTHLGGAAGGLLCWWVWRKG